MDFILKNGWSLPDYSIASPTNPNIPYENRDSCHLFNVLLVNIESQRG